MANRKFTVKIKGVGPIESYAVLINDEPVPLQPKGEYSYESEDPVIREVGDSVKILMVLGGLTNTKWTLTVHDETAKNEVCEEEGYLGDSGKRKSRRELNKQLKPLNEE